MRVNGISIKIAELKFRICYLNLIRGTLPEHLKEINFFVKDEEDETKVAGGMLYHFLWDLFENNILWWMRSYASIIMARSSDADGRGNARELGCKKYPFRNIAKKQESSIKVLIDSGIHMLFFYSSLEQALYSFQRDSAIKPLKLQQTHT